MSSSIHPFVKVQLDKERHLCYGAAAFIEFKERTGVDLLRFMRQMAEKFDRASPIEDENENFEFPIKEFRDILWAGLIHEDPDLEPREVSNMFSLLNLAELLPAVMEAFTLGMPKASTVNGANGNPKRAPAKQFQKSTGA